LRAIAGGDRWSLARRNSLAPGKGRRDAAIVIDFTTFAHAADVGPYETQMCRDAPGAAMGSELAG